MATTFQPPPPPKKSNVLLWVLVGIGGFFLLIALVVVGGIAYVARNPALVMTKVITAANPNVEVLSVNKGSQQITWPQDTFESDLKPYPEPDMAIIREIDAQKAESK